MSVLTIMEVREVLQDTPFGNPKYKTEYFPDKLITKAIKYAGDHAKNCPPAGIATNPATIPSYIMLDGVLAWLFKFKIMNLSINATPGMSDNGIQLQLSEELPLLKKLMSTFMAQFDSLLREYKRNLNIRGGFGTLTSPHCGRNGSLFDPYRE